MESLILPFLNFSILIALVVYFARAPFSQFVKERFNLVADGLNKTKTQVAEAETRRKEIERKFSNLEAEKKVIFGEWKSREEGQLKMIKEGSERTLSQMKLEAENNKKALEEFVRREAIKNLGLLTIDLAKKKISEKLNAETHRNLNEKFSQELGGAQ